MDDRVPIAHTRNAAGRRQPLEEHLIAVARLAAGFAEPFGAGELARWAGYWHDLGKYAPAFQHYLLEAEANPGGRRRGPDHKAAGACLAARQEALDALALLIAGHHGGLPALQQELRPMLAERCGEPLVTEALERARASLPNLLPAAPPAWPSFVGSSSQRFEFFLRMLFSALVDADFLDTEAHFTPEITGARGEALGLNELWGRFLADQEARFDATPRDDERPVNRVRRQVYQACLEAAQQSPGFFSLTVPTGGGKTRSGLGFALTHAAAHGLRRVIVAVPYTTITEQTAMVFRGIFDDERAVLEHHSALPVRDDDGGALPDWSRLAAQNWDAPVIVTTTVQLFESLLGRSTGVCRKLHNVARSVIILDEVQALPPRLLTPILDVLRDLVDHYGCSVVLSTATQPALDPRSGFPGLPGIREIAPEPPRLFRELQRVTYDYAGDDPWPWRRAAGVMRSEEQVLAVLNTRQDALDLLAELADEESFHLSTLLCGAHRRRALAEIRERLARGRPCRVVSTQVVEAGADLDFRMVLRAVGPLDRIVQAAGRCNREGRLDRGRVVVFTPAEARSLPQGAYRTATETTKSLLGEAGFDFHDPVVYQRFFRRYYGGVDLDAGQVQALRDAFDYPEVARRFRLIEDETVPVVVPYMDGASEPPAHALLRAFRRRSTPPRRLWQALQPYVVNVRTASLAGFQQRGLVSEVVPGLWEWTGDYDERVGIGQALPDPERYLF